MTYVCAHERLCTWCTNKSSGEFLMCANNTTDLLKEGRVPEGGGPPEVGVAMLPTTPAGLDGGRGCWPCSLLEQHIVLWVECKLGAQWKITDLGGCCQTSSKEKPEVKTCRKYYLWKTQNINPVSTKRREGVTIMRSLWVVFQGERVYLQ